MSANHDIQLPIKGLLGLRLYDGRGEPELRRLERLSGGASGAATYGQTGTFDYFVKVAPQGHPGVRREVENWQVLIDTGSTMQSKLLRPFDHPNYPGIALYPLLKDWAPLYRLPNRAADVQVDVLRTMAASLWMPSKNTAQADRHGRWVWLETRLRERIGQLTTRAGTNRDVSIQVNGKFLGSPDDLMRWVVGHVGRHAGVPPMLCTIHGDEHPGNILVNSQRDWFVIDYGSVVSNNGDWAYSVAKVLWGWRVFVPLELAPPIDRVAEFRSSCRVLPNSDDPWSFEFNSNALRDVRERYGVPSIQAAVLAYAREFAHDLSDDNWFDRFKAGYIVCCMSMAAQPNRIAGGGTFLPLAWLEAFGALEPFFFDND